MRDRLRALVRFLAALLRPLAPLAALALLACSSSVRRGTALYADGRYVEAAEVFESGEAELSGLSPRERAEYGLYCGLTMQALGDSRSAERWFAYAAAVARQRPFALSVDARALLDRAWANLRVQSDAPVQALPVSGVLAAQQPEPAVVAPARAPKPDEARATSIDVRRSVH